MKQSELLRLYSHMRTALFITVAIAGWGFTYWLSNGEALASVLNGIAITLTLFDILPSKAEISHSIMAGRKRQENIWFKML